MFDQSSRYYSLPTRIYTAPDGQEIPYKARRFLPQADTMPVLNEVVVSEGERLDLVSAFTLGDSLLFWMICDANDAMNPFDVARTGRVLRIPSPRVGG